MSAKKQTSNDITKTGPQNYRAIQRQNNALYGIDAPTDKNFLLQSAQADSYLNNSLYNAVEAAPTEIESPLSNTNTPLGESTWDKDYYNIEEFNSAGDIRANNQPAIIQAINGTAKGAVLAGTTFLNGTIGLLYGLGNSIYEGDASKIWDNPITQFGKELNEESERILPNYYTEAQNNGPWNTANLISTNFLFDKVVKNVGFTVGAAFSGGVYTNLIGKVARGIGGLYALAKTGRTFEEAAKLGARAMDMSNKTRLLKATTGSVLSAMAEGSMEAINGAEDYANIYKQKYDALSAERRNQALRDFVMDGGFVDSEGNPILDDSPKSFVLQDKLNTIEADKKKAYQEVDNNKSSVGDAILRMNLPILTLGNFLTLGKAFAGGYKANRNINKTVTRATKEARMTAEKEGKEAVERLNRIVEKAKNTGYQGLTDAEKALVEEGATHLVGAKTLATLSAIREPLKEGNEEMSQSAASNIAQQYYGSKVDAIYNASTDPEAKKQVLSWWDASIKGFKEVYGDINNYEEGLIGAITGTFGSPTFGKANNSTSETYIGRSKWIGMTGGVVPKWQHIMRKRGYEQEVIDHVNNYLKSGTLERDIKHLIAQTSFDDIMRVTSMMDDKKGFKDSELASIFENIMYLKEAGKLDLLENAIASSNNFTEEDAVQILEMVKKEAGLGGSYIAGLKEKKEALYEQAEELTKKQEEEKRATEEWYHTVEHTDENREKYIIAMQRLQEYERQYQEITSSIKKLEDKERQYTTTSPYMRFDGTWMSATEVLDELNQRYKKTSDIISYISDSIDSIDNATNEVLTNDQLKTLLWYKTMMKDWRDRANNMYPQLNSFIQDILENKELTDALAEIDQQLEGKDLDKLSPEDKIVYGGLLAARRNYKGYFTAVKSILEQLQSLESSKDAGLLLSKLLNTDKKVKVGKDKKEMTYGDFLYNQLKNIIESNPTIDEDNKKAFNKTLEDIKKIGEDYGTYNKLLTEYITNPKKIDENHSAIDKANNKKAEKEASDKVNSKLRFTGKAGQLANDIKANVDEMEDIPLDGWKASLDDEKKEKVTAAEALIDTVDAIKQRAEQSSLDEATKKSIDDLITEALESSDTPEDLFDKLGATHENGFRELIEKRLQEEGLDDLAIADRAEKAEAEFKKFLNEKAKEIGDAMEAKEKARKEKLDKAAEIAEAMQRKEDEQEIPPTPTEKPKEDTSDNTNTLDEDKKAVQNQGTNKDITDRAKRRANSGYSTAWATRPQLSEVYFLGKDMLTYIQYIKEHPESIPTFIEGSSVTKEQYIKYIEATYNYLVSQGAFEYVKHHLKSGDELIFTSDEELNKEAGVPIVVIKAKDATGQYHVVGTMKSSIDFSCIDAKRQKSVRELYKGQYELYKSIIEGFQKAEDKSTFIGATTTVARLMGGNIAFSNTESSISDIFKNNVGKIKFGVVNSSGSISTSNAKDDGRVMQVDINKAVPGQVYILIETNSGKLLPALCYSTSLESLLSRTNDWYIEQIVNAIKECADSTNLGSKKAALAKLLGIAPDNLHLNIGHYDATEKKFVEDDNIENADRIALRYTNRDGKERYFTIMLEADKTISDKTASAVLFNIIKDPEATYPMTVNLDTSKLQDNDYLEHIANYFNTNIVQGQTHSVNDWFVYNPTKIEKPDNKEKKPSPVVPKPSETTPTDKLKDTKTDINGTTISSTGEVTTKDNTIVVGEERNKAIQDTKEGIKPSVPSETSYRDSLDIGSQLLGSSEKESKKKEKPSSVYTAPLAPNSVSRRRRRNKTVVEEAIPKTPDTLEDTNNPLPMPKAESSNPLDNNNLEYSNLTEEQQELLKKRGIDMLHYNKLSHEQKEALLKCTK